MTQVDPQLISTGKTVTPQELRGILGMEPDELFTERVIYTCSGCWQYCPNTCMWKEWKLPGDDI